MKKSVSPTKAVRLSLESHLRSVLESYAQSSMDGILNAVRVNKLRAMLKRANLRIVELEATVESTESERAQLRDGLQRLRTEIKPLGEALENATARAKQNEEENRTLRLRVKELAEPQIDRIIARNRPTHPEGPPLAPPAPPRVAVAGASEVECREFSGIKQIMGVSEEKVVGET